MFGLIPRVPNHMLEEDPDLPNLDPEGRFRKIAEMRHKCRMAASRYRRMRRSERFDWTIETYARKVYAWRSWRAGTDVHQAQGHWLGPVRVLGIEGGNVWVSHRATAFKCAKEQLRMASPAEREM